MLEVEGEGAYLRLLTENKDAEVTTRMRRLQRTIVGCFIATPTLWWTFWLSADAFESVVKRHEPFATSMLELAALSSLIFCVFSACGLILASVVLGLEIHKQRRRRP